MVYSDMEREKKETKEKNKQYKERKNKERLKICIHGWSTRKTLGVSKSKKNEHSNLLLGVGAVFSLEFCLLLCEGSLW